MIDDWAIVLGLELNKLFLRVRTGISMSSYLISVSCYGYYKASVTGRMLLPFFFRRGGGCLTMFQTHRVPTVTESSRNVMEKVRSCLKCGV